jgi:hypothetical protein
MLIIKRIEGMELAVADTRVERGRMFGDMEPVYAAEGDGRTC